MTEFDKTGVKIVEEEGTNRKVLAIDGTIRGFIEGDGNIVHLSKNDKGESCDPDEATHFVLNPRDENSGLEFHYQTIVETKDGEEILYKKMDEHRGLQIKANMHPNLIKAILAVYS
jgi:hypothetical protein